MADLRYEYCPPHAGSRIDHVGTYKRSLPVSLERMYENTLDWEHLPHLHASSFSQIECLDAGGWGWRCRVVDKRGRESELELSLDRSARRWITRNLAGPSLGAEIWTHVFVTGTHSMDLVIDYFVPGVPAEARDKVGLAYARAYEQLYDEDVWMMSERQQRIDERLDSVNRADHIDLPQPSVDDLPVTFELSGRRFRLNQYNDGEWAVYPAACPHQLGPLTEMDNNAIVHCPWHGYGFDVRTGQCVTGASCRLGERPEVATMDGGRLRIGWSARA